MYESSVGRYGLTQERLVVLPPGSTIRARRLWNALRIWPTTGFLSGVAVATAGGLLDALAAGLIAGALVWLAPLIWMRGASRAFTTRIHEEWMNRPMASEPPTPGLRSLARELADSEQKAAIGLISREEFLVVWARAYDAIAVGSLFRRVPRIADVRSPECCILGP